MYESHFGFTGAPFSLNADPEFFFSSRGHSNALSYLKFGVYQGEGFVVVTGEIGAGKTTLVRTLLSGLESDRIVAAQIVSTQLEAGDLLRSIALAFGIAPKNLSKAELIGTIEAFLMLLATENRRALLIVDEAQNLDRSAIEELRMLSNFQLGNQALLQSFLVGQPELRVLLTAKPMEQFRQRVIASCHLGPMTMAETRAYIEHRLQKVGWKDNPSFDEAALERIFHWSAGIPRRVNLLCNRLLLAAFLAEHSRLDAVMVDAVGEEIRKELGEATVSAAAPGERSTTSEPAPVPGEWRATAAARRTRIAARAGTLMVVAASESDDIKAAVLLRAWQQQSATHLGSRLRIGGAGRLARDDAFCARVATQATTAGLETSAASPSDRIGDVMMRFAAVVDEQQPSAIAVLGNDDVALACSLVAHKKRRRLVHLEAGCRAAPGDKGDVNGVLIDRLSDVFYPAQQSAYLNLVREGVSEDDALSAGSLLADAVRIVEAEAGESTPVALTSILINVGQPIVAAADHGYALVALDRSMADGDSEAVAQLVSNLQEISREKRLIWLLDPALGECLDAAARRALSQGGRIDVAAPAGFADTVGLLKGAAFVVTDSPDMQMQAAVLQVRCLWSESNPGRTASAASKAPVQLGESAATLIARHLARLIALQPA